MIFAEWDYIFAERNFICLAMVRGYLNNTTEWIPPEVMQRFGYTNMAQFYASDPSRLALSDIETRRGNLCLLDIRSTIPAGTSYILVDEQQTALSGDAQHRCLPFLEKNGQYWGQPENEPARNQRARTPARVRLYPHRFCMAGYVVAGSLCRNGTTPALAVPLRSGK